ncbi:MAG: tetratricopeptide repeat protein [Limisphaerales bacterium]
MKAGPPDSGAPNSQSSRHWPWFSGLLLVTATFLAYLPALRGSFVGDDDTWTTQMSGRLQNLSGLRTMWFHLTALQQYYPLSGTTFWLDYQLWKFWTPPYHLENVLLHALAALLFWRLLLRLQLPGAWLAAALFALHPVMVESAAWITERKNVLSLALYLAAFLAYERFAPWGTDDQRLGTRTATIAPVPDPARHPRHSALFYGLAFGLFLGALLAKTTAFSLPAAILLIGWWKRGQIRWRADVLPTLPFFALALGLCTLTAWLEKNHVGAQGPDFALTFPQRCLVAGRAFWFYLGKLFWPVQLCFVYPRWQPNPGVWWQWLYPVTAMGTMLGLWLARARLGRGPITALFFFVGTLFPVLGFMNAYFMRYSFVCDHWVYLPSLGPLALAAALGSGAAEQLRRRWLIYGVAVMVLAGLGTLTWRQCGMYANVETLWRTTITRNPDCWLAHNNLGTALLNKQGNLDEPIQHFERALQLKPDYPEAHVNLGVAQAKQGKLKEATQHFERALQLEPDYPETHVDLGVVQAAQGRLDEAIQHYERALQLDPDYTEAHNNLGIALADRGKLDEAVQQYERVLQLKPDYAEAHNNLGIALADQGKSNEAIQHFERALQLKPDYVEAHYNLGIALADQGELDEAIQHYRRALQLKPDYADALNNLGFALAKQGRWDEAIQHYERALQLKPDYADALNNLGFALAKQGRWDEAIQHYERTLQLRPDYAEAHCNLGIALARQGKSAEAVTHLQQALALAAAQGNTALAKSILTRLKSYQPALLQPQTP